MTVIPLNPASPASHAVGIDFDLTLVEHRNGWQDGRIYGNPIPGALDALRELMRRRAVFCVTARHRRYHPDVAAWFVSHGFDAIVDDDPDRAYWLGDGDRLLVTNKKLGAALYIDDRALTFDGDWNAALPEALRRIGECHGPVVGPADPVPAAGRLGLWRIDPGQHAPTRL
ncbi:hypothetical protein [Streptomyces sp. CBMA156]|uniref:hypothetical protein n=1 Tax=Streptomyces sp. CBMA156 TaxID=1930280 RepID=UPI001661A874|nr:hypothetical protein [Streptomyces sp. CBMA156]MBD0675460.1 hypothetical protein [Streptomyces sp. CBMA156]